MEDEKHGRYRKASTADSGIPVEKSNTGKRSKTAETKATSSAVPPAKKPAKAARVRAGEIEAFRVWRVNVIDGRLSSVFMYTPGSHGYIRWPVGVPLHAAGKISAKTKTGVHAWKTEKLAKRYGEKDCAGFKTVIGKVQLWGVVLETQRGYLAEYAKPSAFISWPKEIIDLSDLYLLDRKFDGIRWQIPERLYCSCGIGQRLYELALSAWKAGESQILYGPGYSLRIDVEESTVRVWSPDFGFDGSGPIIRPFPV